jgi:LAS superfamily LD-carboxypeptidase LdcB
MRREHLLVADASEAWRQLKAGAFREGHSLLIVSAFHSIKRQYPIVRRKLEAGATI